MGSLTSLEKYAKEKKVPIIQKEGLNFLLKIIKENNIKTILEIGTAIGYSAINMAKIDSNISVTTIERNNEMYLQAKQNIKDFKLEDRINLIYGDALFTEIEGEYDLIFIDAAKAQYIKFFEKYKKNLNKKGIIITDNLNFHGLAKNPEEIKSFINTYLNSRDIVVNSREGLQIAQKLYEFFKAFSKADLQEVLLFLENNIEFTKENLESFNKLFNNQG